MAKILVRTLQSRLNKLICVLKGGISVCMSFAYVLKHSSNQLHNWWVYGWAPKVVQSGICCSLDTLYI